ncbi:MAG: cell envelope-related transcriptional attenuator [Firmicutes bacterium]|nr:cell envelope-related transcriptional attenuator [Bacillota bacterium]
MASRLERRLTEQKRNRKKRIVVIIGLLFLFFAVAAASYWWFFGGNLGSALMGGNGKLNVLVLGVDERSDDTGRSDTMMVFTIDPKTREVSLLSVPRDTRMKIPGHGWDKINHAYALGGQKLARQAVESLMGIPMDYYIAVNFNGFYKMIDAVGGVTINVEKRMYYTDPYDDLVINLKPGEQRMDGKTAIQYVRYRDEEGDIGRINRQQKFIKAMFAEVMSPSVIPRVPSIIREVSGAVKTDMPTSKMIQLANLLHDAYKQGLKTYMVPGKPAFIGEISYWLPDIAALRAHVAQTENLPVNNRYETETQRMSNEYTASIPPEMKVTELPKTLKPMLPETPADKSKIIEKPKTAGQTTSPSTSLSAPANDGKVRLEIVNASGSPDAGDRAAAMARSRGFEVTGISGSSTRQKNTLVISHTMNNAVVNKLTALPFNYVLQITKDDSRAIPVTIILGSDFVEK